MIMKINKVIKGFFSTLIAGLLFVNTNSFAQDSIPSLNDTVVLSRLVCSINPQYKLEYDSLEKPVLDTNVLVWVSFRVKNAQNIQDVYLRVGAIQDSADCINSSYQCENEAGTLNLYKDSVVKATVRNNMLSFSEFYPLGEIDRINWVSVFCKDVFGNYSNRVYYQFIKE